MAQTRFYFADAATERYLFEKAAPEVRILFQQRELINSVNQALNEIVTRFPATRSFSWRPMNK